MACYDRGWLRRTSVVVNGATGAGVLGGEVRLSRVAIAYEGVSLEIGGAEPEAGAARPPQDTL